MRKLVSILLCAGVLLSMGGCAWPVRMDSAELKMMPPDVALKLVRRHMPSADDYRFPAGKMGMCSSKPGVWGAYPEMNWAMYFSKQSNLVITSSGFCSTGVIVAGLSKEDAIELVAAMNALGAKIMQIGIA